MILRWLSCLALLASFSFSTAQAQTREMQVPRFGKVVVYQPQGEPKSVTLFLSGDGGWHLGVVGTAKALAEAGAVVVGIDVRQYLASLAKATSTCQSLAVDFENLSHHVQKELGLREYHAPVLVGYSSGATIVYATLAQAPSGTFAGAISMGFCPDQEMGGAKLCPGAGLKYDTDKKGAFVFEPAGHLEQPWVAFQGQKDQVCDAKVVDDFGARTRNAEVVKLPLVGHGFGVERNWLPQFYDSYHRLITRAAAPEMTATDIKDLPLTETPAAMPSDRIAVLLTGDGGWAGLDRNVSAQLAARGISTVGFDCLRYFWQARTADEAAKDLERVLRHYLASWHAERFVLVGYSFGADALPFIVRRLPQDLRQRLVSMNLLGPSQSASFEIHVTDWIPGVASRGEPVQPELLQLAGVPTLCLYGDGESDALCPSLPADRVTSQRVGSGHHFSGDYTALADRILQFARSAN